MLIGSCSIAPDHAAVIGPFPECKTALNLAIGEVSCTNQAGGHHRIMSLLHHRLTRRQFAALAALSAAGVIAGDTLWWETLHPELVELDLALPDLPASFDGYRILHLTDFHHSSTVPLSLIESVVERGKDLRADLVALTGDFVTSDRYQFVPGLPYAAPCIQALSRLKAPDGVFAVLGNHDNLTNGDEIAKLLKDAGIHLLRNQGQRITRKKDSIWVGGVDDFLTGRDVGNGLRRALEGRNAAETSLLLAHNPDQFPEFVERGVSVALCGHTHGGQVRLPVAGPIFVPSRYGGRFAYGIFRERVTAMWVSKGIGTFLLPVRMLCRAEMVLITMRRENRRSS